MGRTWVLSVPDGPHVGPMNIAIRVYIHTYRTWSSLCPDVLEPNWAKPSIGTKLTAVNYFFFQYMHIMGLALEKLSVWLSDKSRMYIRHWTPWKCPLSQSHGLDMGVSFISILEKINLALDGLYCIQLDMMEGDYMDLAEIPRHLYHHPLTEKLVPWFHCNVSNYTSHYRIVKVCSCCL